MFGLQKMLNICAAYAEDHNLLFNGKKSTSIGLVKCKRSVRYLKLCLRGTGQPYKH